jgi:hypothetical protein
MKHPTAAVAKNKAGIHFRGITFFSPFVSPAGEKTCLGSSSRAA